mgnify:CR=1 FL=1
MEYLNRKGYRLFLLTNGFTEVQKVKVVHSNLDKYFERMITSEEIGFQKPNPKIFKHALHMAKATAEESLMIGDNLEADIMGALNFGMDAICFNYHKETLASDIIGVDHLSELKMYL